MKGTEGVTACRPPARVHAQVVEIPKQGNNDQNSDVIPPDYLKMQLNKGSTTNFTVGYIINSFDLSPSSEPGFFGGKIKLNINTSDCEISSSAYV